MRRAASPAAPVLLRFAPEQARADAWGRFSELTSTWATVATQADIRRREKVFVSFELGGERWRNVRAVVEWVELDPDGYNQAQLRFDDAVESNRLASALLDALSR